MFLGLLNKGTARKIIILSDSRKIHFEPQKNKNDALRVIKSVVAKKD